MKKEQDCFSMNCNKKPMKNDLYCFEHGLERDAAVSEQAYSASDDKDPWEYDE